MGIFKTIVRNHIMENTDMRERLIIVPVKNEWSLVLDRLHSLNDKDKDYLAINKKWQTIRDNLKRNVHIYILRDGDEIVGMFRESGRPNGFHMLEEFVIFPEYRGKGYSNIMMKFYVDNFPKSCAKTFKENAKMNSLLSKYGFEHDDGKRILNWVRS